MFMLGSSWIVFSRWVRHWLTLRIYRHKIIFVDGRPYLVEPLTAVNKCIIFALHLVILGGFAATAVVGFIGVTKLVYG